MEKRNVVIYVAGMRFSLSTVDSDEYVIEIGEKIDRMMRAVQKENPKLNRDQCAALVALDICDDETKLRRQSEQLREQVKDYIAELDRLTDENKRLKSELEALRQNNASATPEPAPLKAQKGGTDGSADIKSSRHTAFVGKNMKGKNNNPSPQNAAKTADKPFNVLAAPSADVSAEDDLPFQFSFFDNENL